LSGVKDAGEEIAVALDPSYRNRSRATPTHGAADDEAAALRRQAEPDLDAYSGASTRVPAAAGGAETILLCWAVSAALRP
jgi:hypothetical protein